MRPTKIVQRSNAPALSCRPHATSDVPARRRRRGMRLSPLDPFFGVDMVSPFFSGEGAAGNLATTTAHMAIDIVEVRSHESP